MRGGEDQRRFDICHKKVVVFLKASLRDSLSSPYRLNKEKWRPKFGPSCTEQVLRPPMSSSETFEIWVLVGDLQDFSVSPSSLWTNWVLELNGYWDWGWDGPRFFWD